MQNHAKYIFSSTMRCITGQFHINTKAFSITLQLYLCLSAIFISVGGFNNLYTFYQGHIIYNNIIFHFERIWDEVDIELTKRSIMGSKRNIF